MTNIFLVYVPLAELSLFNVLLAYSQYVALRAGVFSMGTAAFTALGSYAAAIAVTRYELPTWLGVVLGVVLGTLAGAIVAIPLSRLRGVFQALATLALVQVVFTVILNWTHFTQGAIGINGIPKTVGVGTLFVAVCVVVYFMWAMGKSSIGRAFDVIREDETVAVSLGISVPKHHMIAFIFSGGLAGLAGALHAYSSYSIAPGDFGFNLLVSVLAMVVLGGRVSVAGPIVGALFLSALPELLREFQDYRMIVQGTLLIVMIVFLPRGFVDTLTHVRMRQRLSKRHQAKVATA